MKTIRIPSHFLDYNILTEKDIENIVDRKINKKINDLREEFRLKLEQLREEVSIALFARRLDKNEKEK